jgi:iron complex transport system ATP-binding protein
VKDRLHSSALDLSGGQQQRLCIARAIAPEPEILLLDEPTASLDLGYQMEIAALLRRLNRERITTMVLSTHDLNLAAAMCDRVVLIQGGRIVADGATEDVLTADRILSVYGVHADVQYHQRAGHLMVVPFDSHH